jgi:hypothetical protein
MTWAKLTSLGVQVRILERLHKKHDQLGAWNHLNICLKTQEKSWKPVFRWPVAGPSASSPADTMWMNCKVTRIPVTGRGGL